ncbi:tir-nbs resistance protein [Corchorus olitorius]|uniref:Tir-nbs resistance protein n=1 Tax=Corchorus olitorius TaxID=93759 RepID=A0A1R3JGR5_9ROSI|nr:tir-nbs resistance protein [Corchorus olitorius]
MKLHPWLPPIVLNSIPTLDLRNNTQNLTDLASLETIPSPPIPTSDHPVVSKLQYVACQSSLYKTPLTVSSSEPLPSEAQH